MRAFLPALLAGAVSASLLPPTRVVRRAEDSTPTVTLDYCTLVPAASNTTVGYYKYQNIRFAAVPTGDLRFAAPEWPPVETEINDGSLADSDVDCSSEEDCLYMDIWAPANANGSLPVLFWTYGGGFTAGSKSQNTPEGLFDLTTDFIFVSYNYRLGMTGLGNGPSLLHQGGTSNVALWDVEHALKWVHKYIGNFGGNPDAITAMGFSAGGSQTLFQMTRFAGHAEQLYAQAYVMSPGFVPGAGHEHAEAFYQNVSTAVGCEGGDLTCLRAVDFSTLQDAADTLVTNYTFQMQPRVDGDFVADTYEAQFYQNRFNFSGPAVITHEQHEANGQAYSGVDTTEDVSTYLKIFFPSITDTQVDEILALYPEDDYTSPGLRFSDMKQHFDLTAHNMAFTHAMNNQTWNGMVQIDSATHGTDQSYYWYSTYTLSSSTSSSNSSTTARSLQTRQAPSTSVDTATAIKMQKYLMSFVLTGNPNTQWPDDKLEWPLYNESLVDIVFNTTDFYTQTSDLADEKVAYWNKALWY
ncbi:hypothetical protein N0V93_006341 [Gnomoniopsis smithogilvyi]|uniref:Carboxylesterase type B domain-containing protein n=1 Tax=Gnomoniopsis smithogilvyi TaxID=1191159 RepID=A0A9W9CVI9_9PEZI|nr:hypothetical protein N0V93_006341 [Gnomoniopsis smithogilvyi]